MDDIPSSKYAHLMFKDALNAMMAEYNAAGDHGIKATDLAMDLAKENLKHTCKDYLSASKNVTNFCDVKLQRIKELQEAVHTNALDTNRVRDCLVSLVKGQRDSESETQNGNAANATSEKCDTAESHALSNLDLNGSELNEAVQQNTTAPGDPKNKTMS